MPEGVEIRRCAEDLGPATKILPAARAYRGQDVPLLLCDDDRAYPPDWTRGFVRAARGRDGMCIARLGFDAAQVTGVAARAPVLPRARRRWRVTDADFQARLLWRRLRHGAAAPEPGRRVFRRSGHVDIFEGCAGALLRPDFFDDTAFDIPAVAWAVDDVWLSGMLARRDIPIWLAANTREPELTEAEPQAPLVTSVVAGNGRAAANRAAVAHLQKTFGIWR